MTRAFNAAGAARFTTAGAAADVRVEWVGRKRRRGTHGKQRRRVGASLAKLLSLVIAIIAVDIALVVR